MSNCIPEAIPERRPASDLTREDMGRVTADDFAELRRIARAYCRSVDYTRSRKRMDGSATVVRGGAGRYGTDDVSDDTTQDAVFIFARRLREIIARCAVVSVGAEGPAWEYVKRDGEMIVITRNTLHYWAVRDAAARNGYRLDVRPEQLDTTPGGQRIRGLPHADHLSSLAVTASVSGHSATIFRYAWGDGADYPTLSRVMRIAGRAEDLGRVGVFKKVAQALYGGPDKSSSKIQRTADAARAEWRSLSNCLDEARDELIYRSVEAKQID